ncbi:MAG TPA: hypothetical protein VFV67_34860 [Actinophytocola sp.]|uniref:hypothetical protein n=1 Tax=Actinophytocola sp. TaxID=1872138 RepID=UPI002DB753AF|nr:hypothetical protein [Actinophytocola sp.]HEU5475847.1 hypothetical protein [Actinophytocola sp.]
MDPRERADAALARARARGSFVVTPESAISPMDAASTLQIPRNLVSAIDRRDDDPEATMSLPAVEPEDTRPAIAQEAATQSLASPAPPARRAPERAPREPVAMSWAPPEPDPEPQPEHVEGLVPTVKQPPATRSSLSQRLDG